MSNPRIRGLVFLGIFIVVAAICVLTPFVIMPGNGTGVALPVIEVPGEVVAVSPIFGTITNTIIGTVITTLLVFLITFILWRVSNGWTKEVPGRAQALFERFIEALYGFLYGIGGDKLKATPLLWPLVATIFFFLLTANYMKLVPGVETVGKMHCAYEGQSGYPMIQGWTAGNYRLWVDEPLNAGTAQSAEAEELCNDYFKGWGKAYPNGFPVETVEEIEAAREDAASIVDGLSGTADLEPERQEILDESEYYIEYADQRVASAQVVAELQPQVDSLNDEIARVEAAEIDAEAEDHGEEAAEETETAAEGEDAEGDEGAEEDGEAVAEGDEAEGEEAADEEVVADAEAAEDEEVVLVFASEEDRTERLDELRAERDVLLEDLNLALTQLRYPDATLVFTEAQLDNPANPKPYIFHITPYVRGPATDLSLTIALALISIGAVQIYGVRALGPAYFEKFVNLSAIGNAGKRPLGIIDFVVGLIEIISEIGKIVSLAFRLFGNLFAGGVALMAMTFLMALIIPGIILGLELIIGAVQALVFAVLTLVFAVQAMEHHGDHDHDDDHGHDAAH